MALLGLYGIVGLTTYVVNLVVTVGIAAGTVTAYSSLADTRKRGRPVRIASPRSIRPYRSIAKVVLASGLTIAGAIACLRFTRLPPTSSRWAFPGGRRIGCGGGRAHPDPSRDRAWQPIWLVRPSAYGLPSMAADRHCDRALAGAHFLASASVMLIGLLTLPGYQPSYNDQKFLPRTSRAVGLCGGGATSRNRK